MKRIVWLVFAAVLFAGAARAQETPRAEVSAGYSYLRLGGSGGENQNGGSASFAFNLNNWLGAVADVGGYHSTPLGVDLNTYTYLFGPRFSYRTSSRLTPFAQVLVGGAHQTASISGLSGSNNAFAFSAGGGVDLGLSDRIALRPQVDYIGLHSSGNTVNCTRVSAAIVFRFGGK